MPLPRSARRFTRTLRELRLNLFRPKQLMAVGAVTAFAVLLLVYASPLSTYLESVALEIGGDLIGAIIVVAILTPLINRAQRGRIQERDRLDYDLFTESVAGATSVVRILDTFSNLFDRPQTEQAWRALAQALNRQASVQVLLLHPDSTAAALRAEELQHVTIRREILSNLRVLSDFANRLDEQARLRFDVRLYSAAASSTLYRSDDRALISFLSLGRLSSQGAQLEITTDSSLSHFAEQHFDELWASAVKLADYLRLSITIRDDKRGPAREFELPYVLVDGVYYLADPQVLAHLARGRDTGASMFATLTPAPAEQLRIEIVDDENAELRKTLRGYFMEKYGWPGQAYLYLTGAPDPRKPRRGRAEQPK